MNARKFTIWRRPWLWTCVGAVGLLQVFTVATSPYVKVPVQKHQPQRVPAAVEPIRIDPTLEDEMAVVSPPVVSNVSEETALPGSDERVIVMSWNVAALAREGSDYDRAAIVLADADIVVLHEMDISTRGKGLLNILGGLVEAKAKQKYCRAWTQSAEGERLRYGYLWRESMIGYMEPTGLMHDECGHVPLAIRQDKRVHNGVHASFYSKSPRKMFELAAVLFDKKPRSTTEVNELFRDMSDKQWPVVVAADFKVGTHDSVLADVTQNGYQFAIDASKRSGRTSAENFWYRNGALASSGTVNLYQRFGDSRQQDIERGLSDQFPLAIELRTQGENKEEMSSALVARTKSSVAPIEAKEKEKVAGKKRSSEKVVKSKKVTPPKVAAKPVVKPKVEKSKARLAIAKTKPKIEKEESLEDEEGNVENTPLGD